MQDGAPTHMVNYSTDVLNEVFENQHKLQMEACKVSRLKSL
jgi:hypothetical protein